MANAKNYGSQSRSLAEKFGRIKSVTQYDGDDEKEAWTLAYGLLDIEESAQKIVSNCMPKLRSAESDDKVWEGLHEIGEELRHILYHVHDSKYFGYLVDRETTFDGLAFSKRWLRWLGRRCPRLFR